MAPVYLVLYGEQLHLLRLERVMRERPQQLAYVQSGMASIDVMPGTEFERYIAARFRADGWSVSFTPGSGDYGVDIIVQKDGTRVAVQCKRQSKPVGVSAIQQVVAGAMHDQCTKQQLAGTGY
jgi:restriction system protein